MLLFIVIIVLILIAVALAWYFISHDRGAKEPIGALWMAVSFGFVGGIVAAIVESLLLPTKNLSPGAPLITLLGASLGVGIIEEVCKFLPLSFFLYPKRYFNEHTDGVIYFALAGLGFGLPENILYSIQFGTGAGLGRAILTPFFHAAITALVGYYLIKVKLSGRAKWRVGLALLAAVVLHGLYDFGLTSGVVVYALLSIVITISLSISLFVLFHKATVLDQKEGLSAVGHNNFCRMCGQSNPRHELYCTHCGRYA